MKDFKIDDGIQTYAVFNYVIGQKYLITEEEKEQLILRGKERGWILYLDEKDMSIHIYEKKLKSLISETQKGQRMKQL